MHFFTIAETAFHHEGDVNYLKKLINMAKICGCDSVKFQILINLDDFMSSRHQSYERAKQWILTREQWLDILQYAHAQQIQIVAMPCDVGAVELLNSLLFSINYLEIHSVSFHDQKLHKAIRVSNNPVILGVGGRTLEEIISAKEYYGKQLSVLMVGFQAFPSDLREVNLKKIAVLKNLFPDCQIGYADHCAYDSQYGLKSLEYAFLLGAEFFEKHIALHEGVQRVDYESAVGREKMIQIRQNLEYLSEIMNGDIHDQMGFSEQELAYRNRQKLIVAAHPIKAGTKLSKSNAALKMSDSSNGFSDYGEIEGKIAISDIGYNEIITEDKITGTYR
jgi:sialic acid synthase SpsE